MTNKIRNRDNLIFNRLSPAQVLALGFIGLIFIGGLILSLPISSSTGKPTPFIDGLFTATSATCVTGLVVVDTGTHYSLFGQIVILLLIQVGGLGFMTMATLFALLMGKKIRLRERLIMQESLNQLTIEGVVRLAKVILLMTFLIEGTGALILALRWIPEYGWAKGVYYGLFHSVSAFNNAGFDLIGEFRGLTPYVSDITINLVISFLIILGGIGFTVILDVYRKRCWSRLSLHTKIVLTITVMLLIWGAISIFVLEYTNPKTLGPLSLPDKILASWFQSVVPRTAGYNTVDIGGLTRATQFLMVILMFIGASSGSTGGGIKTSTFAAIFAAAWAVTRGKQDVELFERRIPREIVYRALAITLASLTLVISVTMILSVSEKVEFLATLFEATSAFATVGLTMGITTKLSVIGKIVIAFTMYAGRVGPLTIALALAQRQEKAIYRFAEEKILVG